MPCSGLGAGTEAAAPAARSLCRALRTSGAPPARHNKWYKVKHIKGLRDTECSRLFQKLAMLLRFTPGGPNPDINTNLANLTEQCRSMVLTKASTEVAIKGRAGCWSASDPGPTAPRPGDGPKGGTLDRAVAGLGANGRGTARNVDGMQQALSQSLTQIYPSASPAQGAVGTGHLILSNQATWVPL
ncbi:unnamed protein product, partial [Natator depressus]